MKLKRRSGGHVLQREYYDRAVVFKKRSERLDPLGPFKVDGKDFVAVAYFSRWSYYKWMSKYGMLLLGSFFYYPLYFRATSLAATTKGMVVLDDKFRFVSNKDQQIRVARTALVWIDVYLCPAFPPKLFNLVNAKMKLEKRLFENCRNRKVQKAKSLVEKLYLEQLKKADEQVVRFHAIFIRHHDLLKKATTLFGGISNRPSEAKILNMKSLMDSLALSFEALAKWNRERARSWTDFVDSYELYQTSEERKKGLLERYGPSAIWKSLMSVLAHVLSGGNFDFSAIVSLVSWFGMEGVKMILSFRWQNKMLRNSARVYHRFSARAKGFSKIYDIPLRKGFLR